MHTWQTVARHRWTRHQTCSCGAWRVVRGWRERWRSSPAQCPARPPIQPLPRGWPHHKAHGEAGFFDG
ncbi:hypothetical protein [Amycolatopsis sp. YIM 10]|uniref:hypothetical protein n=1 Tax=Amycolatopsis sp. YIM 10 TaxID=2653857 RepID=UPI0012900063|nr:hypothetical protein [Amycolatopsis sp. YIM 10]